MHRTRPIAVLASAGLAASMVALGGCSVEDAGSRVAVLGESTPPAPAAPAPGEAPRTHESARRRAPPSPACPRVAAAGCAAAVAA